MEAAGEVGIVLDTEGRLKSFTALPPQTGTTTDVSPPDWTVPFAKAGLDISRWTRVEPEHDPLYYADTLAAWKGSMDAYPGVPLRVEAAARHGKVISFLLTGPWQQPARLPSPPASVGSQLLAAGLSVLTLAMFAAAAFFARRNLRLGRCDRKGAMRIAVVSATLLSTEWILNAHHGGTLHEVVLFVGFVSYALLISALFWLIYVALEPFVRR